MTNEPQLTQPWYEPPWLTQWARRRPDLVLCAPYMAYLILLGLEGLFPAEYQPIGLVIKGIGGFAVFWILRRHMPPLGKAYVITAVVAGALVAAGWVAGQHLLNRIPLGEDWSMGGRFFLFPGRPEAEDPRIGISTTSWYAQVVMRLAVTSFTVPIVEEIFWRGFMLRALINWDRFETVPLGTFTWFSFLGTSLLSMLQHPDNWGVSLACWMVYNALFYWRKSLLCLMITHGVTNFVLYTYVVIYEDWLFW